MMQQDIISLFEFQKSYLLKTVANISDEIAYAKQGQGINSAGWVLGHLCAEGVDVLMKLGAQDMAYSVDWLGLFGSDASPLDLQADLPSLSQAVHDFNDIYERVIAAYCALPAHAFEDGPPSILLKDHLPNKHVWLLHHITTHIAVHIGNLVVWKKLNGLEIGGY